MCHEEEARNLNQFVEQGVQTVLFLSAGVKKGVHLNTELKGAVMPWSKSVLVVSTGTNNATEYGTLTIDRNVDWKDETQTNVQNFTKRIRNYSHNNDCTTITGVMCMKPVQNSVNGDTVILRMINAKII